MAKTGRRFYNVRISEINGKLYLGFVLSFRGDKGGQGGTWVNASRKVLAKKLGINLG